VRILTNYIKREVLKYIAISFIVIISLDLIFYFLNELKILGAGNYGAVRMLTCGLLTIPRKIYELAPWYFVIGTLLGLGNLARDSELIVIQASGLSAQKITQKVIKALFILTLVLFILNEVLTPHLESLADRIKSIALTKGQGIYTKNGIWAKNKNNFIFVTNIKSKKELQEVNIFAFDNFGNFCYMAYADTALLVNNQWELINYKKTQLLNNKTLKVTAAKHKQNFLIEPKILSTIGIKHLERNSIYDLISIINMRKLSDLSFAEYKVALINKVVHPISMLIMALVACPFVFGGMRNTSAAARMLLGVSLAFIYQTIAATITPIALSYNLPIYLGVFVPPLLFSSYAFIKLRQL